MTTTANIEYIEYKDESMLPDIQALVSKDLSEPYSVFTYRYFLHKWPNLCLCSYDKSTNQMIGTIVCKADFEGESYHGYIAMLAVNASYRKRKIGYELVYRAIERMVSEGCDEISLEAEATNVAAISLYEKLGFMKDEKLTRYYLNGGDAYRLKLWVDHNVPTCTILAPASRNQTNKKNVENKNDDVHDDLKRKEEMMLNNTTMDIQQKLVI